MSQAQVLLPVRPLSKSFSFLLKWKLQVAHSQHSSSSGDITELLAAAEQGQGQSSGWCGGKVPAGGEGAVLMSRISHRFHGADAFSNLNTHAHAHAHTQPSLIEW